MESLAQILRGLRRRTARQSNLWMADMEPNDVWRSDFGPTLTWGMRTSLVDYHVAEMRNFIIGPVLLVE